MEFPQIDFGMIYYYYFLNQECSQFLHFTEMSLPSRQLQITGVEESGSFRSFHRSAEKEGWHSWQLRPGCCCSVMCWNRISSEYRYCGRQDPGNVTVLDSTRKSSVSTLCPAQAQYSYYCPDLKHYCNLSDYGSPSLWLFSLCSQVGLTCLGVPITRHRASCIRGSW